MRSTLDIVAIDTHTAGEPTRVIIDVPGDLKYTSDSVREQRDRFRDEHDDLRKLLMKEPRGHEDMYGAIPVPPKNDDADIGVFFIDSGGYKDMCGHGTIGFVTALIETGRLQPKDVIQIETPAGIVKAKPTIEGENSVRNVTVENVESFVYDDVDIELEIGNGKTTVHVDIVYAGNLFAMVSASSIDLEIEPKNTSEFIEYGMEIRRKVNEVVNFQNPKSREAMAVDHTEFYEKGTEADRNIVIFSDGAVDRSPCGTGTCGKMSLLYSNGEIEVGDSYPHESIIGTRFVGEIKDVESRNGSDVILPEVTGSAYIIAKHNFLLDPDDPVPHFSISEPDQG